MMRCEIPRSVLALPFDWFGLTVNDAVMHITICLLTGVLTLANAAFCHGSVILVSDLTLLEIVSPLVCKWHQIEVRDFDLRKQKNTSNSLWMCYHFTFCAMAALLWLRIELPYMTT